MRSAMRSSALGLLFCLATAASAARLAPRLGRGAKPTPAPPTTSTNDIILRTCAAGWAAIEASNYLDPELKSRGIVSGCFGIAQATFEDNIREPASGFLELFAPLIGLQAILLFGLTAREQLELGDEDVSRLGIAQTLTSAFLLGTLGLAVGSGMEITNAPAVGGAAALALTTAIASIPSVKAIDEPVALLQSDFKELIDFEREPATPSDGQVANFYRSSTLTGLLVGSAFFLSPISPIALFDTEAPVTHMLRQDLGVYIVLLLCPVQAALFRAARDGTLTDAATRGLNLVTGIAISALVLDGRAQVDAGNRAFELLSADSPLRTLIMSGDVGRPQANTTAAFTVGFCVGLVYLFQAAFRSAPAAAATANGRGAGRRR